MMVIYVFLSKAIINSKLILMKIKSSHYPYRLSWSHSWVSSPIWWFHHCLGFWEVNWLSEE